MKKPSSTINLVVPSNLLSNSHHFKNLLLLLHDCTKSISISEKNQIFPMPSCFQHQPIGTPSINEDDSVILFSTSNSPDESPSPSSSFYHPSPPPQESETATKLSVRSLSYTIQPNTSTSFCHLVQQRPYKPIDILKSVSFDARDSEILAVVGPSGTGKSSLLRIISGRIREKEFDPKSIVINGQRMTNPAQLRKICGYVAQEDNLLPLLTVKETLMFSAKFRLKSVSRREKQERVESLMCELGLKHVGDSFVGDEDNRGISGGERKRVSIGVDLIHNPSILLLDEPTSGLDSSSALQVIELLASMAQTKQRTVLLSIHQPSYRILQYISNFLILSRGSVVHNGSLELLEETIDRLGFQIPFQLNVLEFAMEIIHALEDSNHKEQISYNVSPERDTDTDTANRIDHKNETCCNYLTWLYEIMYLCSRFWKIIYRTKQLFLARTMQALVGGFGLGSVYIKVKKDEAGIAERLGLFAFSLSFLLSSTVEALPIYLQERRVLMKESSRQAYKISSYMIANALVFSPFLFVISILFAVPVYWIVGLNPSVTAFAFFTFVVWLIVLMASSLVLFLSAVSPDFISGNSLICTVLGAFFLFSGYFIPKESIPKYWMFMYYVSLYRYPLDSLLINEYWSAREECFSWTHNAADGGRECLMTGYDVLTSRGLEEDTRWVNVGIMFGFFVLYRLLCWLILARRASKTII